MEFLTLSNGLIELRILRILRSSNLVILHVQFCSLNKAKDSVSEII